MGHITETALARFAGSDCGALEELRIRWHVSSCESCRNQVKAFGEAKAALVLHTTELPAGLKWERLADEMTANIRLGLEAGECVNPARTAFRSAGIIAPAARVNWRTAAVVAGMTVILSGAWLLNLPVRRGNQSAMRGPRIEMRSTSSGLELNENGNALVLLNGRSGGRSQPAMIVSSPGSLRARYVDADTGQITINNVYAD